MWRESVRVLTAQLSREGRSTSRARKNRNFCKKMSSMKIFVSTFSYVHVYSYLAELSSMSQPFSASSTLMTSATSACVACATSARTCVCSSRRTKLNVCCAPLRNQSWSYRKRAFSRAPVRKTKCRHVTKKPILYQVPGGLKQTKHTYFSACELPAKSISMHEACCQQWHTSHCQQNISCNPCSTETHF